MDESGLEFRKYYPQVLKYKKNDFMELIDKASNNENKDYWSGIQEDVKQINFGIEIAEWPSKDLISSLNILVSDVANHMLIAVLDADDIQEYLDQIIGGTRQGRIEKAGKKNVFPREVISAMESEGINLEKIFIDIPSQRIDEIDDDPLINPFYLVDRSLSTQENYPMSQIFLVETNSLIERGNDWLSVGEWPIANKLFFTALALALATNNIEGVEISVRNIVDTYAATGNVFSAQNIANAYIHSSAFDPLMISQTQTEIVEAVCVAYTLRNQWDESLKWFQILPSVSICKFNPEIQTWRIIRLLSEVYKFQKNYDELSILNTTVLKLIKVKNTQAMNLPGIQIDSDQISLLMDEIAGFLQENRKYLANDYSNLAESAITWFFTKQQSYKKKKIISWFSKGDNYEDVALEKFLDQAVYLNEASFEGIKAAILYLRGGLPEVKTNDVDKFVSNVRFNSIQAAEDHQNFIRKGCLGCSNHQNHSKYKILYDLRRSNNISQYREEIEFETIFFQMQLALVHDILRFLLFYVKPGIARRLSESEVQTILVEKLLFYTATFGKATYLMDRNSSSKTWKKIWRDELKKQNSS